MEKGRTGREPGSVAFPEFPHLVVVRGSGLEVLVGYQLFGIPPKIDADTDLVFGISGRKKKLVFGGCSCKQFLLQDEFNGKVDILSVLFRIFWSLFCWYF